MKRALLAATCLTMFATAAAAQSLPSFSKSFQPSTIGPGSVATLRFDITSPSIATSLAFTDNLPAGMTLASPANARSSCGGTLSAPDGGGTISFDGGQVSGSCSVEVDVTSSTAGTSTNFSGDLTSSLGNSGPATADLVVDTDRPGLTKSFSPGTVVFGGRSTMTLTIDNTAAAVTAGNLSLTDTLPAGMVIASPSNASTDCPVNVFSAPAGGNVVSFSGFNVFPQLAAGASCTVTVDVVGNAVGALGNTTGELLSSAGFNPARSSGKAAAVLTVSAEPIVLTKEFADDPTPPGGDVILRFTVVNLDRGAAAADIAFTDDLDATLSGLAATTTPLADPCGPGSSLTGTSVLTLSGGNLGAEGSCVFDVTLNVPAASASGAYPNTTSAVTATVGGSSSTGGTGSDVLFVEPAPVLTKTFVGDPVGGGDSIDLEFTIVNTDPASSISSIEFIDDLTAFLPFPISATLPASPCGGAMAVISLGTERQGLSLTGGSLAAGDSCTFTVTLDLPDGLPPGTYVNVTDPVTAVVDTGGATVTGVPATDDFVVVGAPRLLKSFTDDPASPGGTVDLQFTLTFDADGDGVLDFDVLGGASDITFTDDLDAVISGLAATGLPQNDVCGPGSLLSGTGVITLTGASLAPDANDPATWSCDFAVTLQVPAAAPAGSHTNTTSSVAATVLGVPVIGEPATDDLRIAGLELTKQFLNDPVVAGGTVILSFTLTNISPLEGATDIAFSDNLSTVLSGLAATGLPLNDICGTGSSLTATSGGSFLVFQGGSLPAGTSCSFDVTLQVPAGAASDTYPNVTSVVSATVGGQPNVLFDPAADQLTVASDILAISKEFVDDPAAPGDPVVLRFSVDNLSATQAVSSIGFTDDLDAALSGLASTSGTLNDICGTGSTIGGTTLLTLSGGNLAAGGSCTFDVTLSVPIDAVLGTTAVNTTSEVTGVAGGLPVTGDPATDELEIGGVTFAKSFSGTVDAGDPVTLTFQITTTGGDPVGDLEFTDDLDAVLSGLAATDTPLSNPCGAGSSLVGSDVLQLIGGNLPPGGVCSFSVTLLVPAATPAGDYQNVTSDLRRGGAAAGQQAAPPATATLTVTEPPPDVDSDGDGVLDGDDLCPGTVIPEGVPTLELKKNRYALVDDDFLFDNGSGSGAEFYVSGEASPRDFTTTDTGGCSCEQIIAERDLGLGHVKYGCSLGVMREWVELVHGGGAPLGYLPDGRGSGGGQGPADDPFEPQGGAPLHIRILGKGMVTAASMGAEDSVTSLAVCTGDGCRRGFQSGTEVRLMARPGGGYRFSHWEGDCGGTSQITTVNPVGRSTVCRAVFEAADE